MIEHWIMLEENPRYEVSNLGNVYDRLNAGSVSKTLRGIQPTCKGYTFERI